MYACGGSRNDPGNDAWSYLLQVTSRMEVFWIMWSYLLQVTPHNPKNFIRPTVIKVRFIGFMGFDLYTRISSQSKKIGPSRIIRITMDVYVYFGRVQITPSVILAIMRSVAQGSYGSSKYLKVHKK